LFDEAEQVLQAWQTMDLSDDSQIRSAYINRMSQFYTTKATVFGRQGKAGLVEQLDWIDLALQYNPKNLAAIHGIMALAEKRGTVADEARTKLKEALANGIAPATAHFILGNVAWERGEPDAAREQMEIAYRLNPRMPDVGNNLAWYLADAQSPDLSRALNIINGVLEVDPSHAGYRETRGQILVKLGRWRDALVDLETALPTMRDDRNLHSTLATVYRNLGDTEMASQHERIVLQLSPKE
jgi:Tfp pilus assembly protein PilF